MAILLIGLVVLIQLPGVQTFLADKIIQDLETGLGADISLGSIRIRPFNRVLISDLTITDDAPISTEKFEAQDTVVHIGKIMAYCSLGSLINSDNLTLRRIRIDDPYICLVVEKEWNNNFKRCLKSSSERGENQKAAKKRHKHTQT